MDYLGGLGGFGSRVTSGMERVSMILGDRSNRTFRKKEALVDSMPAERKRIDLDNDEMWCDNNISYAERVEILLVASLEEVSNRKISIYFPRRVARKRVSI